MRIFAGQRPDGRWEIYASWVADDEPGMGVWIATVDQAALGRRIDELVRSDRLAGTASPRRRTKGAGG